MLYASLLAGQGLNICPIPVNTTRSPDAGTMLGQRRRWWPNIVLASGERVVFSRMHL